MELSLKKALLGLHIIDLSLCIQISNSCLDIFMFLPNLCVTVIMKTLNLADDKNRNDEHKNEKRQYLHAI